MSLFVISDLHIWGVEDPLYHSLVQLLRVRARTGDTVVLAGDVFDLFVGNKEVFTRRYEEFIEAMNYAGNQGVEVHYIEGNHDFLIRKVFLNSKGITVHPTEVHLALDGKRFYFAHGDLVDSKDYPYRALRLFLRSPVMKAFVTLLPGNWIDWIGRTSSEQSRKKRVRSPRELPIERMEMLRKAYRNYAAEQMARGFDFVVLGHCHDLDEMHFQIGGRRGQYINVGFPRMHGSFLTWDSGEEKIHREKLP